MTDEPLVKKKRGRKPKPKITPPEGESSDIQNGEGVIQKRRGRRRKYEIENYEKLLGRNNENTFDHQITYDDNTTEASSDNDDQPTEPIKKNSISFGNLNITISKKQEPNKEEFRKTLLNNVKSHLNKSVSKIDSSSPLIPVKTKINIDENEYSDDEDTEIARGDIVNQEQFEQILFNRERYLPKTSENTLDNKNIQRIRVVQSLKSFKKETQWPEKTDVCCWHCCHKFDSSPCFIPKIWDEKRNRINFFGVFCSWSCAKTYNSGMGDHKSAERCTLLTMVVRKIVGKYVKITPAPPRQSLKMFGGYLSIDEFRKKNLYCEYFYKDLGMENFVSPNFMKFQIFKKIIKPKTVENKNYDYNDQESSYSIKINF